MEDLAWLLAQHDRLVALRREFHAHPEIAFEEEWTADRLSGLLSGLGCRISRRIGGTGFVATLPGGDGPAVALRTDMDALPQDEATGLAYASTRPGRMHACGHDAHTAMLMGAAEVLAGDFVDLVVYERDRGYCRDQIRRALADEQISENEQREPRPELHACGPRRPASCCGSRARGRRARPTSRGSCRRRRGSTGCRAAPPSP